jgi:hypothetical protein
MSGNGTTRTFRNVRYSVAVGGKADIEQAESMIVLSARQGASLRRRRSGATRSLFRLMGRDTAYWYRRGRGVPVGEGRVAFRDVRSVESKRVDEFANMSDEELRQYVYGNKEGVSSADG